jgi:1-acyl-sn-glycerol-3-phosphate acyltransferase
LDKRLTDSLIAGSRRFSVCKWFLQRAVSLFCRIEIVGLENVPERGPAILAPNHISYFDPPIIGLSIPRKVHFMTMHDLFQRRLSAWMMNKVGAFPVIRNSPDRRSVEHALALLKKGALLCIFPEGGINKTGARVKSKAGLGLIALESGIPIIPIAIAGTRKLYRAGALLPPRTRIAIRIGEGVQPRRAGGLSKKEMRKNLLGTTMERIYELRDGIGLETA